MPKMTRIAGPALLAAMAIGAAPAPAAPPIHPRYSDDAREHYAGFGEATGLQRRIAGLDRRIDHALAHRHISWREATRMRRDVDRLEYLLARAKRGGLTRDEARMIEARIAEVDRTLHFAMHERRRWRG